MLSLDQLRAVIQNTAAAAELLRFLADNIDLFTAALEESQRMREAVKSGCVPGDYEDFVRFVTERDGWIGELLAAAHVEKFDVKRLILEPRDGLHWSSLSMVKARIESLLHERYGTRVKTRLKQPENRAE
jgi:hypothetical protein